MTHAARFTKVAALALAAALPALAPPAAAQTAAPDSAAAAPAARIADWPNARPLVLTKRVQLDRSAHNVVRTGPGDRYAIAGVFPSGTSFPVLAARDGWFNVQISETETGWIHESLCTARDDLSGLQFRPNPRLYTRTGSFRAGAYGGAYAFDRKSNSLVLGGRLGYYVFDRLQAEAGVAWTHVRRPAEIVESLFDLTLEAEDFHMLFYHLNVTLELLPGRQMVPFLTLGAGSAIMQGETEPSINFGAGTTLFLSKRTAIRWEVRDYHFRSGSHDARFANDNIEFSLGTELLF